MRTDRRERSTPHPVYERLGERARLAWDTIEHRPTQGIPTKGMNLMHVPLMEELAGVPPGDYEQDPEGVYLACQKAIGACAIDQWIPRNPLTMTATGYDNHRERDATTGAERIECDGVLIDSPEAVAMHLERLVFPGLEKDIAACDPDDDAAVRALIDMERDCQQAFGPNLLKIPYAGGFQTKPSLRYRMYGYANYFMAYALYPGLMETDFRLQADLAAKRNAIAARAYAEGALPKLLRLDHDMADSRGTLVDVKSLDRIWFPHFARAVRPLLDAGVNLIWHCDGNLMDMVPRLLDVGLVGFQGFQYEAGMDYRRICAMRTRDGEPLIIQAGVSVTTTLPHGTRQDVKRELDFLVANGPPTGLFLGASSSITPGTNPENVKTLVQGLAYYREHGRN